MSEKKARPWDLFNKNIGRVETVIAQKRFEICKSCPELIKLTSQCKKCGCFMEAKTKLPNAECPIGKWDKVSVSYKKEL
jgi:hypothetical protein